MKKLRFLAWYNRFAMGKINPKKTNLERPIQLMPHDIKKKLEGAKVLEDYYSRPDYQKNDYLAWIARAKQPETREKRISQMLSELQQGGIYMDMDHPASTKPISR